MTTRPMKETYRYDIAFLRCLAILMVLFYHLQVPFFGSGFLGVDLFFVLSGYLMTQILSGDLKQQRFNLWGFYKRRMNRIFPVFFLVLITFFSLLFGLFWESSYMTIADMQSVARCSFRISIIICRWVISNLQRN